MSVCRTLQTDTGLHQVCTQLYYWDTPIAEKIEQLPMSFLLKIIWWKIFEEDGHTMQCQNYQISDEYPVSFHTTLEVSLVDTSGMVRYVYLTQPY